MSTTKKICVSSDALGTVCNKQTNSTTVRLQVEEPTPGTFRVVLRNDTAQEVGCVRQELEDLPPPALTEPSLYVVVRPETFKPTVLPVTSNTGTYTPDTGGNAIRFVPPALDREDEWFLDLFLQRDGVYRRVARVRTVLVHG